MLCKPGDFGTTACAVMSWQDSVALFIPPSLSERLKATVEKIEALVVRHICVAIRGQVDSGMCSPQHNAVPSRSGSANRTTRTRAGSYL
jgi:hypothetical protein